MSEALTGERAGWVLSREIETRIGRRRAGDTRKATFAAPRGRGSAEPARSETPDMHGSTARGNREIPWSPADVSPVGRIGKSMDTRR